MSECVCVCTGEVCQRHKGLTPLCAHTISALCKDDCPVVLAHVMRATTVLFRKALIYICSSEGADVSENVQGDMWKARVFLKSPLHSDFICKIY